MAVDVGSAVGYLDLDISGFLSSLKSAQSEADSVSRNIATKIGTNVSKIGTSLSTAGTKLTAGITTPVVGLGTAAVATTANFESAMSKVSAISGATGTELDKLNAKAQEMGAKTKFSATESAEAFTYMAMAGWKTEDMLEGIEGIMSLAAADGLDLATTSDIVTDALTAFGLSASDSGHFADVLAKAASNANTNVTLLGESFKYAAPVAGALGYSAEDTAAALGLMANAGIKGSQGGTALRSSISRLIKPTDQVASNMEKYNLSLTNSDGSMKSLGEVMKMLRTNLGNLSEAEQAQAAAALFGQEAMSGMLAIINASESDYDKLTDAINNADGAAQEMSEVMLDNFSGQVTLLKSALEGLAIQFGEVIMPYVKQFVEWIQKLIQKFQELTPEQKDQVVRYAAIAAAIGPVLLAVGKLTAGVGNIITMFGKLPGAVSKVKSGCAAVKTGFTAVKTSVANVKEAYTLAQAGYTGFAAQTSKLGTMLASSAGSATSFGGAIAAAAGPILAIVAVIAVLVAAFINLWKNNEEFRNKITEIWNGIKEMFSNFFGQITEAINSLGFDFENFGEVLRALWQGLCDFLAPIFVGVFQYISDKIQLCLDVILGVVNFFVSIFKGDWEGAWNAIKDIFISIWEYIVSWFQNIGNTLLGILDVVCGWFGTTWDSVWTSIKDFFINIWTSIKDFFVGIWDGIVGAVQSAWDWIVGILSGVGTWIYDNVIAPIAQFFTDLWNGIVNAYHTVIDPWIEIFRRLKNIFYNDVIQPIKKFFVGLWNSIVSGLQSAWNWIVNLVLTIATWVDENVIQPLIGFFTGLWETISGAASDCWNAIVGIWNTVSSWFSTTVVEPIVGFFTGLWDGLKNGAQDAWNGITSIFSAVAEFFGNIFKTAWEKVKEVFSTGGEIFGGIVDGILEAFKSVVNVIITGINKVVALPFNGLNDLLDTLYNLEIVGVKPFTWITWRAPVPQIPMLAKGAVLPANNPFLAVVGDQKHGTNVEAPLSTIQEAVALVLKDFASRMITLQEMTIVILGNVVQAFAGLNALSDELRNSQISNGQVIDYEKLAAYIAATLKDAPIQAHVSVEMEDGDVYMDKERVGRTVAPVVSRVIVQKS